VPTQQDIENDCRNATNDGPLRSNIAPSQVSRPKDASADYAQVDVDNENVHFEMVPAGSEFMLWLIIRRGISPQLASTSLRKIADLIDHHGQLLLGLLKDKQSCLNSDGEPNLGSQRLDYDDKGNLVYPVASESRTWAN
jgi:hypothetical protein